MSVAASVLEESEIAHQMPAVDDPPYVALAEAFDYPLLTLDLKLSGATGPRCRVVTPPVLDS